MSYNLQNYLRKTAEIYPNIVKVTRSKVGLPMHITKTCLYNFDSLNPTFI